MAANEILPFAQAGGANVQAQATYNADGQRTAGNQPGVARSDFMNKTLRQVAAISAGLAQFMADRQASDITDSLTPAQVSSFMELSALAATAGRYSSVGQVLVSTVFSASVMGTLVTSSGAGALAHTMPSLAGMVQGKTLRVQNTGSVACTIGPGAGQGFTTSNVAYSLITLQPGDEVLITSPISGVNWLVNGSGSLSQSGSFAANLAASGYQRLPSGLIIQWQVVTVPASSVGTFTLPITFPAAFYAAVASQYGTTYAAGANAAVGALPNGLSQVNVQNLYSASSNSVQLLCIGK